MKTRVRRHRSKKFLILVFLLIAGYVSWTLLKPLPPIEPTFTNKTIISTSPNSELTWPTSQAAAGVVGTDILETSGNQQQVPLASTAKILTALLVLEKYPLLPDETGPKILITEADVQNYRNYLAKDGSVIPVRAGDELTQYQMLQALMLPSANNIADKLAIWSYGSLENYAIAAHKYLESKGINNTQVGADASGLSPDTKGTSEDLVKIGTLAMENPVLASIVAQPEVQNFPLGGKTGTIKNVNFLLGTQGIIGLKTGNSDEAGGAFVSASKTIIDDQPVIIVTAVSGAKDLVTAMRQSLPIVSSAQQKFTAVTVVKAGQKVGIYKQPWGGEIPAITKERIDISAWKGSTIPAKITLRNIEAKTYNEKPAGLVVVSSKAPKVTEQTPVILQSKPTMPSIWWKLTHPIN